MVDNLFHWEYPCPQVTLVACSTFAVAFLSSIFVYFSTPLSNRKILMGTSSLIHLLATISYLLMHLNLVPQIILNNNLDRPYVMLRPFEWLISVPLMITLVGELVRAPSREIQTAKFRTIAVMSTGGLGPLFYSPWNYILFTVSCAFHVYVMYTLHKLFDSIKSKLESPFERRKVFLLKFALLTLFSLYPIFWVLSVELRWLSLDKEMIIFSGLDMSAKILLTSILGNLSANSYELDLLSYPAESLLRFVKGLQVPTFSLALDGSIVFWSKEMDTLTKIKISDNITTSDTKAKSIFDYVSTKIEPKINELLRKSDNTISYNRRAERAFLIFRTLGDDIPIPFHVFNVSSNQKQRHENPTILIFVHIGNEVNQDVNYFTKLAYAYSQSTEKQGKSA